MTGSGPPPSSPAPLAFRPSGPFLLAAALSPVGLIALGAWGLARAGEPRAVPVVLLALGLALAVVVAVDLPYRVEVGSTGVTRVCPLRRQQLPWDDIIGFSRTRVDHGGQRLLGRAITGSRAGKIGGLVVLVGPKRRRYLLSDRAERRDQFDALRQASAAWAPGVSLPVAPG